MNRKTRRAKAQTAAGSADKLQKTRDALQTARAQDMQGNRAAAEKTLRALLAFNPACPPALYNLGIWSAQREDFAAAEKYFTALAALEPNNADVLCSLAILHFEQGAEDKAQALTDKILKQGAPADVLNRLGNLHREAGRLDSAKAIFENIIEKHPNETAAYFNLRSLKSFGKNDVETQRLLRLYETRQTLSPQARTQLIFTLADIFIAAGENEAGFAYLAEANREKRAGFAGFDMAALEKYTDDIIAAFTPDTVARLRSQTPAPAAAVTPVLVIGMPRSGSTLIDQILASHGAATSLGESTAFLQSLQPLFGQHMPALTPNFINSLTPQTCNAIGQRYLAFCAQKAGTHAYIVDKQLFNFQWLGFILLALPQAKIIHSTRDARDMGLSIWRTPFTNNLPWACDQREIARYYKTYQRLMTHWQKLFADRWLTMSYEDMTQETEAQSRRLLDYCGLPWDDACLRFYETKRQVKTASVQQVRRPVYRDAVGKWQKYEEYLQPLLQELTKNK